VRENIDEIYLGPNWSTSEAYLNCRGFRDVSGWRIVVGQKCIGECNVLYSSFLNIVFTR